MTDPAPHNFSYSPVEEVSCSCTTDTGSSPRTLIIHPPYPGWTKIRRDLQELISGESSDVIYTSCILRYRDRFHPDNHVPEIILKQDIQDRIIGTSGEDMMVSIDIPGTEAYINHSPDDTRGDTLTFTIRMNSARLSDNELLMWFDAAHTGIHILFDLCVPEENIQTFR